MRRWICALVLAAAFGGLRSAAAEEAKSPTPSPEELRKLELDARGKAASELCDVAKFCRLKNAYDEARTVLEKALVLSPQGVDVKADLDKMKNQKGATRPAVSQQIDERRTKGLAKCTELIAPVCLAYARANLSDDFWRMGSLLRTVGAPPADLDIAYFEPYLEWRSKKEFQQLQDGWECEGGAWIEPDKVAEMNRAHANWETPWTVCDDSFEVRTNQPLRVAREVLRHMAAFRRRYLDYFAGEWELKPCAAKLQIVVGGTRAELDDMVRILSPAEAAPQTAPHDAVAYYVDTTSPCNPCVACFEALDLKDRSTKFDFKNLVKPLEHEVGRQLAFEYSKHAKGLGRLTRAAVWAIEGVAEFAPYLSFGNGAFTVTRPSWIPSKGKEIDSAFQWCRTNIDKIPPIDEFVGMPRAKYLKSPDNGRIAATLTWYLLEGKGRAYRKGFVKFLELVHQDRDGSDALTECLPGVDLKTIDKEFRAFCAGIQVEER